MGAGPKLSGHRPEGVVGLTWRMTLLVARFPSAARIIQGETYSPVRGILAALIQLGPARRDPIS
jgi:hypothetical protein